MRVRATHPFLRLANKTFQKNPGLKEPFRQTVVQLVDAPFTPSLKTHKLKGDLKEFWSCSVTYEIRLRFKIEDDVIVLVDIGSHDEVY